MINYITVVLCKICKRVKGSIQHNIWKNDIVTYYKSVLYLIQYIVYYLRLIYLPLTDEL